MWDLGFEPSKCEARQEWCWYQSLFCVVANLSTILCTDLLCFSSVGSRPEQSDLYIAMLHSGKYFLHSIWHERNQSPLLTQEKPICSRFNQRKKAGPYFKYWYKWQEKKKNSCDPEQFLEAERDQ